jgi:hypothetical protein
VRDARQEIFAVGSDGSENAAQRSEELSGIVGASVRQRLLGELPAALIRVQLGSVAQVCSPE